MTNESVKLRWIKVKMEEGNKTSPKIIESAWKNAFDRIEKYELRYKKDCCDFNEIEIKDSYLSMNFCSIDNLIVHNNYYSQYTRFCIEHNIAESNINNYENFKFERLKEFCNISLQTEKILSRKDVLSITDRLPYYVDKFVVLGFFEGLNGEYYSDFINLKTYDIDQEKGIFYLERGEFNASKELINYAIEASKETNYAGVNGEAKIAHPYVPSDNVFKEFKQSSATEKKTCGRRVQVKINKIFNYLDMPYITITAIINSGKIYYLKNQFSVDMIEKIFTQGNESEERKKFESQFCCVAKRSWLRKFQDFLGN